MRLLVCHTNPIVRPAAWRRLEAGRPILPRSSPCQALPHHDLGGASRGRVGSQGSPVRGARSAGRRPDLDGPPARARMPPRSWRGNLIRPLRPDSHDPGHDLGYRSRASVGGHTAAHPQPVPDSPGPPSRRVRWCPTTPIGHGGHECACVVRLRAQQLLDTRAHKPPRPPQPARRDLPTAGEVVHGRDRQMQ